MICAEPLETEGKTEGSGVLIVTPFTKVGGGITTSFRGVGSFIYFPLLRTIFFFFFAGAPVGREGEERFLPGALRKVSSFLLPSRSSRRAWRAWASALRTSL